MNDEGRDPQSLAQGGLVKEPLEVPSVPVDLSEVGKVRQVGENGQFRRQAAEGRVVGV